MKAQEIATEAARLVKGDREASHGNKFTNHAAIAAVWTGYILAREVSGKDPFSLDAEDVANMMELLKVARRLTGTTNNDDYIDGAGYAAVAGEIREYMDQFPISMT
jgi:hypothetical protein